MTAPESWCLVIAGLHHIISLKGKAFKTKTSTYNLYVPFKSFQHHGFFLGIFGHGDSPPTHNRLCLTFVFNASKWPQRFSSSSCELLAETWCDQGCLQVYMQKVGSYLQPPASFDKTPPNWQRIFEKFQHWNFLASWPQGLSCHPGSWSLSSKPGEFSSGTCAASSACAGGSWKVGGIVNIEDITPLVQDALCVYAGVNRTDLI